MKGNPNILLIVMDAVRADHLSCYGYKRPTTPFLEQMAADGVIFDNAFAAAPWTPPSHASLFTGTYPSKHGVDVDENLYLHDGNVTLAQILGSSGYRTFAILPDAHLSAKRGFHRGFQDYIEVFRLPYLKFDFAYLESSTRNLLLGRDKRSYLINRLVKRWLTRNAVKDEPFFVFVNYKTAHNRYQAPWSFRKRFEIKPDPDQDKEKLDYFSDGGGYPYMARKFDLSAEDFAVIKSWYDGAVACIDDRIRDLVQYLKKMKLYENTLIIVTADHGENFGEHGLAYHLFCLYETLIRVPLIFHAPALFRGPIRVPHLVSLIDVLPTLLDILKIDYSRRGEIDGRSLLPFDGRPYHSHIFSEFDRPTWMLKNLATRFPACDFSHLGRGLRCVRTAEHKLIVGSDGTQELYHLPSDPGEIRNLIEQNPEQANILQRTLENWLASFKVAEVAVSAKEDDAVILKNLRDLGYV